jgi:alpha-L-arabinofuranosidase
MGTVTCLTGGKNDINTFQNKERVAPQKDKVTLENGMLTIELPAYSATVLTFKLK